MRFICKRGLARAGVHIILARIVTCMYVHVRTQEYTHGMTHTVLKLLVFSYPTNNIK